MELLLSALLIAIAIWIVVSKTKKRRDILEEINNCLRNLSDFNPNQTVASMDMRTALAIDEARNQVCLLTVGKDSNISCRLIPAGEILSAEIVLEGKSGASIAGSAIGGALVGSIFGDAGAIIGSNVAASNAASDIESIALIIHVNDTRWPLHRIYFSLPGLKDKRGLDKARRWSSVLEVMSRRSDGMRISPAPHSGIHDFPLESQDKKKLPQLPPSSPSQPVNQIPCCFLRSVVSGRSMPLKVEQAEFAIGRAGGNDLILQDAAVSRQHALLRFVDGRWMIQDRNSTGGLFVNDQRVRQQWLKEGDRIRIGSSVFIFSTK